MTVYKVAGKPENDERWWKYYMSMKKAGKAVQDAIAAGDQVVTFTVIKDWRQRDGQKQ